MSVIGNTKSWGTKTWGAKSWGYKLPDAATVRTRLTETFGQQQATASAFAQSTQTIAKSQAESARIARQMAVQLELGALYDTMASARFRQAYGSGETVSFEEKTEERPVFSQSPVYRNLGVYEAQDVFAPRDITEMREIFETCDMFESRDVIETRDVYETRDIFETRPVFEDQPIYATTVTGSADLTGFRSLSDADIDRNADLSVRVGDGPEAIIRFTDDDRLVLIQGGDQTTFRFNRGNGSWRAVLAEALSSIDGLSASIDADGSLVLETENAQALTLSEVESGRRDDSGDLLPELGLEAGTFAAEISGYEQVQTGTEEVAIGTEDVLVGTEDVVVGTQSVLVGTEEVKIGEREEVVGSEQALVGTRNVQIGSEPAVVGYTFEQTGTAAMVLGFNTQWAREDRSRDTLTAATQRALRERIVSLERAIGPADSLDKNDPFKSLASAIGTDRIKRLESRSDLQLRMTFVKAALQMFQSPGGATSAYTQRGMAGQGRTLAIA